MSSVAPAVLPDPLASGFISIAGTELPLPPDARKDLAYRNEYTAATGTAGNAFAITVPGDYYEIPVSFYGAYVTDNTVVNRQAKFSVTDSSGQSVIFTAAVSLQTASQGFGYSGTIGGQALFVAGSFLSLFPVPILVANPGYTMFLLASGHAAGDAWSDISFTTIRIPTGPGTSGTVTPLVPTLQLV